MKKNNTKNKANNKEVHNAKNKREKINDEEYVLCAW